MVGTGGRERYLFTVHLQIKMGKNLNTDLFFVHVFAVELYVPKYLKEKNILFNFKVNKTLHTQYMKYLEVYIIFTTVFTIELIEHISCYYLSIISKTIYLGMVG